MSTFKYSIGILILASAISSTFGLAYAGEGPHEQNGQNIFEQKAEARAAKAKLKKEQMKLAEEKKEIQGKKSAVQDNS